MARLAAGPPMAGQSRQGDINRLDLIHDDILEFVLVHDVILESDLIHDDMLEAYTW